MQDSNAQNQTKGRRSGITRPLLACGELPVGRSDLSARQRASARTAAAGTYQAAAARTLGTTPGLNFIYAHLNRVIKASDLNVIYVCGPGHGGPGMVANTYLEGTYSEIYPDIGRDADGLRKLFRQFSFPGGIPSHAAPETPGSIHEGGELGYALVHAYGAAFDNPDLLVACVVGDGEAETGPLAASWHSNKFLNPAHDGAVLPILHLNGYKIANPHRARPDARRGDSRSLPRLRPRAVFCRRQRSRIDASADGRYPGYRARPYPNHSEHRARWPRENRSPRNGR